MLCGNEFLYDRASLTPWRLLDTKDSHCLQTLQPVRRGQEIPKSHLRNVEAVGVEAPQVVTGQITVDKVGGIPVCAVGVQQQPPAPEAVRKLDQAAVQCHGVVLPNACMHD